MGIRAVPSPSIRSRLASRTSLAGLEPPDIATMPIGSDTTGKTYGYDPLTGKFPTITGGTLTLNPGYYPGGIDMSGGSITLNPGVYAFGGAKVKKNNHPGLVITGGAITGGQWRDALHHGRSDGSQDRGPDGVRADRSRRHRVDPAHLARRYPDPAADRGGDGYRHLAGPRQSELWQDRSGPAALKITGTIYCGYNAMEVGGTADQTGNQVIAGAWAPWHVTWGLPMMAATP